jgi:hypothetical protein
MISVDQDDLHIFVHIHTQYYGHEYRVMAPLSDEEARQLVNAVQTTLRIRYLVTHPCICVAGLPVMAGCPHHDAGPYPGPVTIDSGLSIAPIKR